VKIVRTSKTRTSRVKTKINKSRQKTKIKRKLWKGGVRMNAVIKSVAEEDVQLTCLTEISNIMQSAIKKKGLTYEQVDKSYGLVRKHNVKRKN